MNLEIIYITTHYACGHDMLRAIRRDDAYSLRFIDKEARTWYVGARCKACSMKARRAFELRMERAQVQS